MATCCYCKTRPGANIKKIETSGIVGRYHHFEKWDIRLCRECKKDMEDFKNERFETNFKWSMLVTVVLIVIIAIVMRNILPTAFVSVMILFLTLQISKGSAERKMDEKFLDKCREGIQLTKSGF